MCLLDATRWLNQRIHYVLRTVSLVFGFHPRFKVE